jgi:hypothetical protein
VRLIHALVPILVFSQASFSACVKNDAFTLEVEPVYDTTTGKLRLLQYDSNRDGKIDTWSYVNGSQVVRIEVDRDGDGRVDQWQYYEGGQRVQKVGFSMRGDGKEDAWLYLGPDGTIARVESSPRRDGTVSRIEHYENGALTRAEEDTDGDGRVDRWETYQESRLLVVAFDTTHRGTPDRRIVYDADANGRVEVDLEGTGHFVSSLTVQNTAVASVVRKSP